MRVASKKYPNKSGIDLLQEKVRQLGLEPQVKREVRRILVQQQLADLRERRGLSQAQLAAAIGVSQPRIAQIEKGRIEGFRIQTLMRVAEALGADLKIDLMPRAT